MSDIIFEFKLRANNIIHVPGEHEFPNDGQSLDLSLIDIRRLAGDNATDLSKWLRYSNLLFKVHCRGLP